MTRPWRAADFDYDCPPDLVAQHPAPERGTSRLMVVDRTAGTITHAAFPEFSSMPAPGDCLVVNSSRVIPARLHAIRDNGRPAELLLVHEEPDGTWQAMVHPGGKLKTGRNVWFGTAERQDDRTADAPSAEIVEVLGSGLRRVRFHGADARTIMGRFGAVPLPPYIHRAPDASDADRY
ncbi:MAG TPA: S-adenosylmethionine:tRNA ribosyltransferase-isomerase, partial [Pseudomonadales bacterium]|nr:S-adenosylmethionine:tRNA ribosyltransferase-isomerase [Pseudomonadales bacterium]